MTEQTVELLKNLAAKLGQSIETLWPKAIRYVVVDAITGVIFCMICLVVLAFVAKLIWKHTEKDHNLPSYEDPTPFRWLGIGTCLVAALLCVLGIAGNIPRIIEPAGYLTLKILKGAE